MAEQSSSSALKELDEQLTCCVCLEQYTKPKTLQCHHSFCLKCIEKLPHQPQVNRLIINMKCYNPIIIITECVHTDTNTHTNVVNHTHTHTRHSNL